MPGWCLDQPQLSQGLGTQDQPPLRGLRPTACPGHVAAGRADPWASWSPVKKEGRSRAQVDLS